MKSGSRASLLASSSHENKNLKFCKNGYDTTKSLDKEASQLKRFKSLPSGKINRRLKRKAPSPPKNIEPYKESVSNNKAQVVGVLSCANPENATMQSSEIRNPTQNHTTQNPAQPQPPLLRLKDISSPENTTTTRDQGKDVFINEATRDIEPDIHSDPKVPRCPEGVKLRRRAKCLQQKYNFNQRQSMYCAKLQQFSNFLKGDNRRHSFYGLSRQENSVPSISLENVLDSEEDLLANRHQASNNIIDEFCRFQTNLLRSPSDSSLMYLNQIALASSANFISDDTSSRSHEETHVPGCKKYKEEIIPHQFMPFDIPPSLPPKTTVYAASKPPIVDCMKTYVPISHDTENTSELHSDRTIRELISPQILMTSSSRTESQQSHYSFYTAEAIYDTVPKPRSCLSKEQLENNHIYDIPRRLLAKNKKMEKTSIQNPIVEDMLMKSSNCLNTSREANQPRFQERASSSFEHSPNGNHCTHQSQNKSKSKYGSSTSINGNNKIKLNTDDPSYYINGRVYPSYNIRGTKRMDLYENEKDEAAPSLPPRMCPTEAGPKLPPKNKTQFNLRHNFQEMDSNIRCQEWSNVVCSNINGSSVGGSFSNVSDHARIRNVSTKSTNSMDNMERDSLNNDVFGKEQYYERCQSYTTNGRSEDHHHFEENKLGKSMEYAKTPYGEVSSSFTESTSTLKSTTSIDTFSSLPPPPTDFELYQEDLSTSLYSLEREFASLPPIHSDNHHEGGGASITNSQNLSTFSSVSSVTLLQDGDVMSFDNSSLPGDPFPQGLPCISSNLSLHSASSSSTLESPVSSPFPQPPKTSHSYERCNHETDDNDKDTQKGSSNVESSTERNCSRNEDNSVLLKHNSESNLSRLDDEFENVEEQKYILLQSSDQVCTPQIFRFRFVLMLILEYREVMNNEHSTF